MSFFFRPAFYPEHPIHSSPRPPVSDDEAYYRRVAEEHQRRAQAALALAQEEERRRRQTTVPRPYHDELHFRPDYRPEYVPARSHYSYGPFDSPFDSYESQHPPRYEHLPDAAQRQPSSVPRSREQAIRDDHERHIEEYLQRRRQRDLEEAEFRRLKELERRRDDELMREMLASLGIDSIQSNRATPATTSSIRPTTRALEEELTTTTPAPRQVPIHSQTCACNRHIPSPQPAQASEPASTPTASSSPDFATQLWNALTGGRSDEERASILRELGLGVPFNVMQTPNTRQPAAEQRPVAAQRSTAAPNPITPQPHVQTSRPAPARIPVIVRSPAPATPQPKPSTSRNASPAPVKLSPFAHIESIQTKFDSLRASTPDLSNPQKQREYLAELNKLLTSLDQVESSGSESIRGARKALVRAVEEELENVEGHMDEEKHELTEEKQVEGYQVEVKEEEKPTIVETAPQPQASAQLATQDIEIQSVTDSEPTQVHPAEPTVEEPAEVPANVAAHHLETGPQSSFEHVPAEDEAQPEAQATLSAETVSTSSDDAKPEADIEKKASVVSEATEEQLQRGRQPAVMNQVPKSPKARRPPSVEIEEVPDEESLSGSPRVGHRDF